MSELPMQSKNRHSARRKETFTKLLIAAEEVFVRDGFESAQLDEIATRAERSKGAVYTHFKSKEDLFLGLIEHRIGAYIERYANQVVKTKTRRERINAFREFYVNLARDTSYHVLTLEFKL